MKNFADSSKLYNQPQSISGMGLAIHVPTIIASGALTATPTFPADGTGVGTLAVTGTSLTSAKEGMTVILNDGTRTYTTYCRKDPTASFLYIDGLGAGTVSIVNGSTFNIYKEFLPWPRRFRYSSTGPTWYCNFDEAYVAQNSNFGPQAIFGGSRVKYANGSVSFVFSATGSIAWTPGSTIASYAWTFPDASTSTSATPTWTTSTAYNNGDYVKLIVTDSNGDTHTSWRLIFKFDSTHKPKLDFEPQSIKTDWGGIPTCTIHSTDIMNESYERARNHCLLFGTSYYGSTQSDQGGNYTGGENIYFDGWIMSDTPTEDVNGFSHIYELQTVAGMMDMQDVFPVTLDDAVAPASWLEMKDITLDRMIWHEARWRSTLACAWDVHVEASTATGTHTRKYGDAAGEQTLWAQFQQIYSGVYKGTVTCDLQSGLWAEQDCIVAGTTASTPQILKIFNDAITVVQEGYVFATIPAYVRPSSQIVLYGVDYATPAGARANDDPISHGKGRQTIPSGLFATTASLQTWSGNAQAQLNNTNTTRTYPLIGNIRIDPSPQSVVSIDATGTWTHVVRGLEISFDMPHGMVYTAITCEVTITGISGTAVTFT